MSVSFREKFKSRHTVAGGSPSVEIVHLADVVGETNEDLAIKTAALATLPDTYDDKPRQSIEIEELAPDLWQVTTTYAFTFGSFVLASDGSASSFDTTGGTRRVTQSIRTVSSYAIGTANAPDFQGAIGVSESGVEGVDIPDRRFVFRETRIVNDSAVDAAYKAVIWGLTGKVNDADFLGFPAGSVIFHGATGALRSETEWEIVYHFEFQPNATGLSVGQISDIDKKGWEYLWVVYEPAVDDDAQALVRTPSAVYVEQVVYEGDFSTLDL
ncbi:MAG: hypothetical protein KDB60_11265 [Propionibacteriaceae bacterium]|nr:hypothetical protein [Propionibacteriaceae bacterium]